VGSKQFRSVYDFARHDADAAVRCAACGHEGRFEAMEFVRAFGGPLPLHRAERRLRCGRRGARGRVRIAAIPQL
jgi:hypothetical protein